VQHERKPLVDRKNDALKNAQNSENSNDMSTSKSRGKQQQQQRDSAANNSVNYLSLFQLNPLLMHAAGASQFPMPDTSPPKESPGGLKNDDPPFLPDFVDDKISKSESNELYESVLEQKMLNDTLDMIQMVENSLTSSPYDALNGNYETLTQGFMQSLLDEGCVQFKVQIPNLLPKMHFVCEIGSRVLFKTIDWLRDLQVGSIGV
jgi:hypothetical protein